mgnify:CR=1 FL=1
MIRPGLVFALWCAIAAVVVLNDLVGELADHHGIDIHRVSVWRFLRALCLTHKKRPARRAFVRH